MLLSSMRYNQRRTAGAYKPALLSSGKGGVARIRARGNGRPLASLSPVVPDKECTLFPRGKLFGKITVGDSGLCCSVPVTSIVRAQLFPIVC